MHRRSIPTSYPEQYYRVSIFFLYFDQFINELQETFTNYQMTLSGFNTLFKKNNYFKDFKIRSDKYTSVRK